MNKEFPPSTESDIELGSLESWLIGLSTRSQSFLASWMEGASPDGANEEFEILFQEAFKKIEEYKSSLEESLEESGSGESDVIKYDKFKKEFFVESSPGEKQVFSESEILTSRHFKSNICFSKDFTQKGFNAQGLFNKYKELLISDYEEKIFGELIASFQIVKEEKIDALKSRAYGSILKRLQENEIGLSRGILAEKMSIGFLEEISFKNSAFKIEVLPASPYDDVEEKIDFIIKRSETKRGVNVTDSLEEAHSIGIQLTTNKDAISHKHDQIQKSKDRGVHVDDVMFLFIPPESLDKALLSWKKDSLKGPWKSLPSDTKRDLLDIVFKGILSEEEIDIIKKQNL